MRTGLKASMMSPTEPLERHLASSPEPIEPLEELLVPDWDAWRANYWSLSDEAQKAFHRSCERYFPEQAWYDIVPARAALELADSPLRVLEIGGWKGDLAAALCREFSPEWWVNVEFCDEAAYFQPPRCTDDAYIAHAPTTFRWWFYEQLGPYPLTRNVVIATHVIEHLAWKDLQMLLDRVCAEPGVVHLEAPIELEGQGWGGYHGSHMLEVGWREVAGKMAELGFERVYGGLHFGTWRR